MGICLITRGKLGSKIAVVQIFINYNVYNSVLYYAFIQPLWIIKYDEGLIIMDFTLSILGNASAKNIHKVQRLQNRIAHIMSNHFVTVLWVYLCETTLLV